MSAYFMLKATEAATSTPSSVAIKDSHLDGISRKKIVFF